MTASGRTSFTSSGMISGTGLASANTSGRGAIADTISLLTMRPAERPRKTSAPGMISASVRAGVSRANGSCRDP